MHNVRSIGNIADCEDADGRTAPKREIQAIQSTKINRKEKKLDKNANVPGMRVRESKCSKMDFQFPTPNGLMVATTCLNEASC